MNVLVQKVMGTKLKQNKEDFMQLQTERNFNNPSYAQAMRDMSDEMQKCIQDCIECHQVCLHAIQHCIEKGGKHAAPEHIKILQDCAQICATSADFMLRHSDLHKQTCGICAEVCKACADDCEQMKDDEMMAACAEICRRCAETCEKMAAFA